MKSILLLCVVFSTSYLVSCQTPPDLSEIDAEAIIACVQVGIEAIPDQSEAVILWGIETFETVDRLIEQRRRCNEMTNDRLQQACMATWTATTIFEANRIRNDLASVTNEETADIFREHFLHCFEVDPDAPVDPIY